MRGSEKSKMCFDRFVVFASSLFRDLKNRRKLLNFIVFIFSLFSIVSNSQGLPNGPRGFGKVNQLTRMDQDFRKFANHGKSHHLSRRIASVMVPVREREMTSICTYEVTTDVNLQRIPDKIDRVLCRKDSCKCVEQGDYRCTQLYTQLNVTYLSGDWKTNLEFELIDVEYACVCSKAVEGSNVNLLEPILV